jgi:hypothetical protein
MIDFPDDIEVIEDRGLIKKILDRAKIKKMMLEAKREVVKIKTTFIFDDGDEQCVFIK